MRAHYCDFYFFVGNEVEVVIAEFNVLGATNIQIFNEIVGAELNFFGSIKKMHS